MREVNASEEQEQESSEWNVRELSGSEFDELSAASRYGGFQQTSEMAALAQSDGMQTQYVGLVDSHDAPVAGWWLFRKGVSAWKARYGLARCAMGITESR